MFIDFRERRRKRDWEISIPYATWDRTHNLGMCLDWELNPQPLGVQNDAPTNLATWSG